MTALEALNKLADDMRNVKYNAENQMRNSNSSDEIQALKAQIKITEAYLLKIRDLKSQLV